MDKAALVTAEFAIGAKLLEALDHSDLAINVALWVNLPEYGDWRFVLSSRRLDAVNPLGAYGLVREALERAEFALEHTLRRCVRFSGRPGTWKECVWVDR